MRTEHLPNLLTFDLGTTLIKVAVFDGCGKMRALERVIPPISRPTSDHCELGRDAFIALLRDAVHSLRASIEPSVWSGIRGISFATQANSFALLDDNGDALTPFILWPDRRAAGEEIVLSQEISADELHRVTGVPRFSPLMTSTKLRWMRRTMPDVMHRARRLVFLSDELTYWLTGERVTEGGMAALSGMLDIETLQWWPRAVEVVGIDAAILPEVKRAGTNLGPISSDIADALGLSHDCQFIVGCLDQYAGAIGTDATEPGDVCETTGTVLAAVRAASERTTARDVFEAPGYEAGRFWQMSFSSTSANLLEWYRNSLPQKPSFEELSNLAREATSAAPIEAYREGESIESCFRNVRPQHSAGEIARGIMVCVALALKDQVNALCGDARPTVIKSAGGAAKSKVWLDIKSQIVGIPCVGVDCEEPTSLGSATLALRGLCGARREQSL